ncbi:MAG: hypothetical protein V7754_12680 [Halioglobus sp.]
MLSHSAMIIYRALLALLLTHSIGLYAAGSDTVNERIPVRKIELEEHWQVDCKANWQALRTIASDFSENGRCDIPSALPQQLQLCSFIYQPPGDPETGSCPDHRRARQAAIAGDCRDIVLAIEASQRCQP